MTSSLGGMPPAGGGSSGSGLPPSGSYKPVAGRTSYMVLHGTAEIVTPDETGTRILRYPKGAIAFRDGRVLELGTGPELLRRHGEARPINANGRLVTPGLVDCHTHMIFAGHRAHELQRKLAGESYAAIAAAGGGIRSTVAATAAERDDVLEKSLAARLERWRANACTTVEVKSGYGLTPDGELRLLGLMRAAVNRVPVRVVRTALLLHALPDEYRERREAYIDEMIARVVPEIAKRDLAQAVDVFCDPVGFTVEECRRVLLAAREQSLAIRLHVDQTKAIGGAKLAAELSATSADHLECASEDDWKALAAAGTVGVLLPASALTLGQKLPKAKALRAHGARIAVATDFNPGTAPAQSLLECATLASRLCGFTADETLMSITWNAARALGLETQVGHLNPGAWGDAIQWECESLEELPYWMPAVRPDCVFMRGADLALPAVERRVWP